MYKEIIDCVYRDIEYKLSVFVNSNTTSIVLAHTYVRICCIHEPEHEKWVLLFISRKVGVIIYLCIAWRQEVL